MHGMGGENPAKKTWAESVSHLKNIDVDLADIIDKNKGNPPEIVVIEDPFEALVRAILHQSVRASQSTKRVEKLMALFGGVFPRPGEIITFPQEKIREVGISMNQAKSILRLAIMVLDNKINFDQISKLPDEKVVKKLMEVPGVGLWTSQMYLVFHLQRPDVCMVGDISLANATAKVLKMEHVPDSTEMDAIFSKWKPWRSAAAWYIWNAGGDFTPGLH